LSVLPLERADVTWHLSMPSFLRSVSRAVFVFWSSFISHVVVFRNVDCVTWLVWRGSSEVVCVTWLVWRSSCDVNRVTWIVWLDMWRVKALSVTIRLHKPVFQMIEMKTRWEAHKMFFMSFFEISARNLGPTKKRTKKKHQLSLFLMRYFGFKNNGHLKFSSLRMRRKFDVSNPILSSFFLFWKDFRR
jgi:hypothetical protein